MLQDPSFYILKESVAVSGRKFRHLIGTAVALSAVTLIFAFRFGKKK